MCALRRWLCRDFELKFSEFYGNYTKLRRTTVGEKMGNVKEKQVGEIFQGSQKLEIARDKVKNGTMFHFNL